MNKPSDFLRADSRHVPGSPIERDPREAKPISEAANMDKVRQMMRAGNTRHTAAGFTKENQQ